MPTNVKPKRNKCVEILCIENKVGTLGRSLHPTEANGISGADSDASAILQFFKKYAFLDIDLSKFCVF